MSTMASRSSEVVVALIPAVSTVYAAAAVAAAEAAVAYWLGECPGAIAGELPGTRAMRVGVPAIF